MQVFIRLSEFMRITGLRKSAIYQGMADGWFPQSIKIGPKSVAWSEDEIAAYQDECIARRDEAYANTVRRFKALEEKQNAIALLGGGLGL